MSEAENVTIEQIFMDHMAQRLNGESAAKIASLNHTIGFTITGGEAGEYTLKLAGGKAEVLKGLHSPQVTLSVKDVDWKSMTVTKTLNPMQAFMGGKLKVSGDMGLAMKLGQMGIM
ncbi:MAG: SCP2 sterol-binding domain-containing protein [Planctomycetes bacterium]|nr:SCP2 sterol-binding domain-containing protein [Planctomycetota bacterium]